MTERLRVQLEGALQVTVVALVVTFAFVASHIYPWNSPDVRPLRTFVLLELGAIAVAYVLVARARLRPLPAGGAVGALTAVALLSTAWSSFPTLTLERALGFAALVAAAAAIGLGVAGRPRAAGHVMLALLAGAVVIALAGLVELWQAYDNAVLPATRGQGARYNGIGQNPNQIAMLIAVTLPFALWAIRSSTGAARVAATAAMLLLAGSAVASGSRGALLGAFLGCLVYLLDVVPRRRVAVAAGALVAFGAAIALMQLPQPAEENPPLYEEFGRTPVLSPQDLNAKLPLESEYGFPGAVSATRATRTLFTSSGRVEAWELAVWQGLERPLAGYGFGTEDEVFVDRSYAFVSQTVENSFIGAFLQLGAAGVAVLVAALVLPLLAWLRARSTLSGEAGENAAACAGAVVAGIVIAVPQSYVTAIGSPATAPFWIAVFLLGGLTAGGTGRAAWRA